MPSHPRVVVCLRSLTLLLALSFVPADIASAEDVAVHSGDSVVLERSTSDITGARAQLGSVATATKDSERALVYVAPATVRSATDTVNYQLGAANVERKISILPADQTLADDALYGVSFKAIFTLLILAVLVENGLVLLFRWRPYLDVFDSRATNVLVALAFALFFVRFFELDIVTALVNVYRSDPTRPGITWAGSLLSAAIIAGGSAAVNRVFQALGFRPVGSEPTLAPRPPQTEAWIAVKFVRNAAVGPVFVSIEPKGQPAAVAGTISGPGRRWPWIIRPFLRDRSRYPQSGGHSVPLTVPVTIAVSGKDLAGNPLSKSWGPETLAAGALVDLELSI